MMKNSMCGILSAVLKNAWKWIVMPLLLTAILLGQCYKQKTTAELRVESAEGRWASPPEAETDAIGKEMRVVRVYGGNTKIIVDDHMHELLASLIIENKCGSNVMTVNNYSNGTFDFHAMTDEGGVVFANGKSYADGTIDLSASTGKIRIRHKICKNGISELFVTAPGDVVLARYRIMPDGELIRVSPNPEP